MQSPTNKGNECRMTEEEKRNDRIVMGTLLGYTVIALVAVVFTASKGGDEAEAMGYPENQVTWRHSEYEDPCGDGQWYSSCPAAGAGEESLQATTPASAGDISSAERIPYLPEAADTGLTH